jgi:hypothetical protein
VRAGLVRAVSPLSHDSFKVVFADGSKEFTAAMLDLLNQSDAFAIWSKLQLAAKQWQRGTPAVRQQAINDRIQQRKREAGQQAIAAAAALKLNVERAALRAQVKTGMVEGA